MIFNTLYTGLLLKFLVSMQRAKYVLDVGMFTGYSALSMAEALPTDGKVFTCDREQYLADVNRKVFDSSPHGHKIEIRLGKLRMLCTVYRVVQYSEKVTRLIITVVHIDQTPHSFYLE